jgi:uncharacterized protein YjbI with pentapeptide repeats
MANRTHVALLKEGVEAWNQWRRENPKTCPNLFRADLTRASLSGADLRRTNLGRACLRYADLRGAQMVGADLHGADLRGAELIRADLRRADLHGADLFGANLSGADLSHANLRRADLDCAKLRGTGLSKSGLSQSQGWVSGMKWPDAIGKQKAAWDTQAVEVEGKPPRTGRHLELCEQAADLISALAQQHKRLLARCRWERIKPCHLQQSEQDLAGDCVVPDDQNPGQALVCHAHPATPFGCAGGYWWA